MHRLALLTYLSCLFCIATASAQESSQVRMKVDLVAWGNNIPGLTLKDTGGEKMKAMSFAYNTSLTYSGPQILAIYQVETKEENPNAGGDDEEKGEDLRLPQSDKEIDVSKSKNPLVKALFARREKEPELVSLVELPRGSSHVTILLAPASSGTFQPYVIDDDPRKLPKGKLRVHNLSPLPIRIEQIRGKQRCQLAPQEKFLLSPDENERFVYKVSYKQGDTWKVQTNNSIRVPENQQTQFIVLRSDNDFFVSSDGSRQGVLQFALLKRDAS